MVISTKIAKVACAVAFVIAASEIIAVFAVSQHQAWAVLHAVVALIAAIGILHKRVWSAYGYAVFNFAQLLVLVLVLLQSHDVGEALQEGNVGGMVISVVVVVLFAFAGRSLQTAGSPRGFVVPWIAASILCSLP